MTRATHTRLKRAFRTGLGWGCVVGLTAALSGTPARAEGEPSNTRASAPPWVSLKLSDLGVPPIPQAFMNIGSSMLTVNLIDSTHLLLTYSTRGLVPRLPGDPPDDDDRMVAAEVVELPNGKILARTEWHMHDHSRYLWRLGRGRFLVRSRNSLYVIAPGARLNTDDPLRPAAFPSRPGGAVTVVQLSPDSALVTVETTLGAGKKNAPIVNGDRADKPKPEVILDFYRLKGGVPEEPTLSVIRAGVVKSPVPLALPLDGDGYLWPGDHKRGRWEVSFNEYGGKAVPVGSVMSSCPPRMQLVSRSEYIVFACQGSEDRMKMEAFGMDGHETWEEPLGSTTGLPAFAFAPEAGRFAISRIATIIPDVDVISMVPDGATQEMRVYQIESGDLLLRVPMTPVMRNSENFDLSDDGMVAAVVNAGAVQVYKLRALNAQDEKDLKMASSFCPPVGDGPVDLSRLAKTATQEAVEEAEAAAADAASKAELKPGADTSGAQPKTDVAGAGSAPATEASAKGSGSGSTAVAAAAGPVPAGVAADPGGAAEPKDSTEGDPGTAESRKAPTLLEPGEKAEYRPGGSAKDARQQ